MAPILTKQEVDSLVAAVQDGTIDLEPVTESVLEYASYDFSKPHALSRTFAGNLTTIADSFAKGIALSLSSLFRSTVSVAPAGIRHVLFTEYARFVPKPSAIAIVNLPPLRGQGVLIVDPALVYVLVDKLMGGSGRAYSASRDFTEIEFRIADRIIQKLLGDLKSAAGRFVDLGPSIARIENNIEFVTICSGMDRVVSLTFEVKMGETAGTMDVTVPIGAFEPVSDRFDPVEEMPERTAAEKAEDLAQIQQTLREVRLAMRVVIGETDMPVSRARGLAEGDTIVLDRRIVEPVDVLVEGVPKFLAIPGRMNGKKGIRLHSVIKGGDRD